MELIFSLLIYPFNSLSCKNNNCQNPRYSEWRLWAYWEKLEGKEKEEKEGRKKGRKGREKKERERKGIPFFEAQLWTGAHGPCCIGAAAGEGSKLLSPGWAWEKCLTWDRPLSEAGDCRPPVRSVWMENRGCQGSTGKLGLALGVRGTQKKGGLNEWQSGFGRWVLTLCPWASWEENQGTCSGNGHY